MTTTLVLIWKLNCSKCEQVKPLLTKWFEKYDNVMVHMHESKEPEAKALIKEFGLTLAPTLLVFNGAKLAGKIEYGFTEKGLVNGIEKLTGKKLE